MFSFVNNVEIGKISNMEQRTKWITKMIFIAVLVHLGKLHPFFFQPKIYFDYQPIQKKCSCKLYATEISELERYFWFLKEKKFLKINNEQRTAVMPIKFSKAIAN